MEIVPLEPTDESLSQEMRDSDSGTERRPDQWQPLGNVARRVLARLLREQDGQP